MTDESELRSIANSEKFSLTRDELLALKPTTPDVELERDIRELTGGTTDDLGRIE